MFSADISIGGVNLTQKALFAKHLAVMLRSGLTITEALGIAADSSTGKMKRVSANLLKSVEAGNPLSEAMQRFPKVFSGLFVSAVYSGEESGTLEENLENIAEQLEKQKELSGKIKGAMLYPIVVLVAAFILGMAMAFLVLPKIVPLFEGLRVELPFTTKALIWFAKIVQEQGLWLFGGIIVGVIFLIWLFRQKFTRPISHGLALRFPVVKSITRNANLSEFCRTLGTLLKSGLNIDEALRITGESLNNYHYKRAIKSVTGRVSKGTKLSDNLKAHGDLFPKLVTRMIRVGEESGKLDETLTYLADFYDTEVEIATKTLSTAIEPILLIVIGLIVGFLALSIITPIYQITGSVKR